MRGVRRGKSEGGRVIGCTSDHPCRHPPPTSPTGCGTPALYRIDYLVQECNAIHCQSSVYNTMKYNTVHCTPLGEGY